MKKSLICFLFLIVACGPNEEDVQAIIDEAVENALETTTTTSTTTTVPLATTTSTTTTSTTTTTVPLTTTTSTTTTVPLTTTTSTTTTVPPTNIEIKLPNETNQFPEIPYCKMTYEEVEKQVNDFFQSNDIRVTIREFIVQTDNVNCYGYVSGSNYSYTDTVESGDFIEITVEGEANKRKFPTVLAGIENAKGNNEFFQIYCDLSPKSKTEKYWNGVLLDDNGIRDVVLYSQPNDLDINLNDPYSNCGEQSVLENTCFWRVELRTGERVYKNPNFPAVLHYGATNPNYVTDGEPFNICDKQIKEKEGFISIGGHYGKK